MYEKLSTFLSNKKIIYDLQFGFRQQYFISYALINITENIKKLLMMEIYVAEILQTCKKL